jgi:hypothetical protein
VALALLDAAGHAAFKGSAGQASGVEGLNGKFG